MSATTVPSPPSPVAPPVDRARRRRRRDRPGVLGGRYRLLAPISAGGMGEVFVAYDVVLGREVAVKLLHPAMDYDPRALERFGREARSVARLSHPNIVAVHDRGSDGATPYMVMELVRGRSLREVLAAGRLEPAQVAAVLDPVLAALEHARIHGVVHCDLKPENILLAGDGTVKVADFGLARTHAQPHAAGIGDGIAGTPGYLAPEQLRGEPVDTRTDLYALGVVAFELLTGRSPLGTGLTPPIAGRRAAPVPVGTPSNELGVSDVLDQWVGSLTAIEPAHRPASPAEARTDLRSATRSVAPAAPLATLVAAANGPTSRSIEATPSVAGVGANATLQHRTAVGVVPIRRAPSLARTIVPIALAILALGALLWGAPRLLTSGTQKVPPVAGLSPEQARAWLRDAGFVPRAGRGAYSESVPRGEVIRTDPAAGERAAEGSRVVIVASRGPRPIVVPSVLQLPGANATTLLETRGLRVETFDVSFLGITGTNVVRQSPAAGTRLRRGDTVTLYLD